MYMCTDIFFVYAGKHTSFGGFNLSTLCDCICLLHQPCSATMHCTHAQRTHTCHRVLHNGLEQLSKRGVKTVAILEADELFTKGVCEGALAQLKKGPSMVAKL